MKCKALQQKRKIKQNKQKTKFRNSKNHTVVLKKNLSWAKDLWHYDLDCFSKYPGEKKKRYLWEVHQVYYSERLVGPLLYDGKRLFLRNANTPKRKKPNTGNAILPILSTC